MKFLLAWIMALVLAQNAFAGWKEKAWQCYGEITMVTITDERLKVTRLFQNQTQSNHYYKNLGHAVQQMQGQLSKKTPVCQYDQLNIFDDTPTSYGYWYKEGENKTHDFIFPINWIPYDTRVRKIRTKDKYLPGDYRVCNYACKSRRVDPERDDIVFHE